jgi:hypothetical protein
VRLPCVRVPIHIYLGTPTTDTLPSPAGAPSPPVDVKMVDNTPLIDQHGLVVLSGPGPPYKLWCDEKIEAVDGKKVKHKMTTAEVLVHTYEVKKVAEKQGDDKYEIHSPTNFYVAEATKRERDLDGIHVVRKLLRHSFLSGIRRQGTKCNFNRN